MKCRCVAFPESQIATGVCVFVACTPSLRLESHKVLVV
jgi:hypothetical protein